VSVNVVPEVCADLRRTPIPMAVVADGSVSVWWDRRRRTLVLALTHTTTHRVWRERGTLATPVIPGDAPRPIMHGDVITLNGRLRLCVEREGW
jgi:hypothetical protein